MKKLNKKGFTLVELIVVIAIIGILAAVLVPSVTSYIGKAQKSSATQNAANKYQEYVLAVVDACQKDIKDVTRDAGWFWTDGTYVCLIVDGTVTVTEKTDAKSSNKNIFKFYKETKGGDGNVTGYGALADSDSVKDVSAVVEYNESGITDGGTVSKYYRLPNSVPTTKGDATCSSPFAKA